MTTIIIKKPQNPSPTRSWPQEGYHIDMISDTQQSYRSLVGGILFWGLKGGTISVFGSERWWSPREVVSFPKRQFPGPKGVPCYSDHTSLLRPTGVSRAA